MNIFVANSRIQNDEIIKSIKSIYNAFYQIHINAITEKFNKPQKVPESATIRSGDVFKSRTIVELMTNECPKLLKMKMENFLIKSIALYLFGFLGDVARREFLFVISTRTNDDFAEMLEGIRIMIGRHKITSFKQLDQYMFVKRERADIILDAFHYVTGGYPSDSLRRPIKWTGILNISDNGRTDTPPIIEEKYNCF